MSDKMDKNQRLAEIYKILNDMPSANSVESAFLLLHYVINFIEDKFTIIPYRTVFNILDRERMYAPIEDTRRDIVEYPHYKIYKTRKNHVFFNENGAILITDNKFVSLFSKVGLDNTRIEL